MSLEFINRTADRFGFIPLTRDFRIDSMWGNFISASDGKIYIAAGNHETFKGDTWFFQFDPETDQIKQLFSAMDVLGIHVGTSAPGECKVHTRLVETHDGKIIFSTMQGGIGHISKWAHYEHPDQYGGGHLFEYDISTGKVHDFGIPVKYEGIQTQVLDKERNILYFVTWPKKLFGRFDLNTRRTDIYGVFSWSPARDDGRRLYFGRDILYGGDGKIYSINHHGCFSCFDPENDTLEDTDIYVRRDDSLRTNLLTSGGITYLSTSKGYLFSFDAKQQRVEELGMVMPDRAAYTPNLAISRDEQTLIYLGGSHSSYSKSGVPLIEFDVHARRHHILGDLDPDFFPPSCFGAQIDSRGRYLFALHGGEPNHSYLAIYDPKDPERCRWLLPHGSKPSQDYFAEGFGGFGNTNGWIATQYQVLNKGPKDGIPSNDSAITSLITTSAGTIYGATSSMCRKSSWLFKTTPDAERVDVLAELAQTIPEAREVRNSLVEGSDGCVYGGTLDMIQDRFTEKRSADFPKLPDGYPGGHLFKFDPDKEAIIDLGIPVKNQGIYCMCSSPEKDKIYALTYPHAYLVSYSVQSGKTEIETCIYDAYTDALRPDEYELAALPVVSEFQYNENNRILREMRDIPQDANLDQFTCTKKAYVSRAIICDRNGNVYGSSLEGSIFCYHPEDGELEILPCKIPMVNGTNYGLISEPSISCLYRLNDGSIAGGTTQDGYLFRLDSVTRTVFNFGKPIIQGEIRALVEWEGALFGIVGEDLGKTHLFRYDDKQGLKDLGVLQGGGHSGFPVNVCDTMLVGADNSLFIGQAERASSLLKISKIEYEPLLPP